MFKKKKCEFCTYIVCVWIFVFENWIKFKESEKKVAFEVKLRSMKESTVKLTMSVADNYVAQVC